MNQKTMDKQRLDTPDRTRRNLLLGSSVLPLVLMLPGCGGGGDAGNNGTPGAVTDGDRATAQGVISSGSGYVDIGVYGVSALDPVFRYSYGGTEYLRYFVPSANRAFAIYDPATQKHIVQMVEVITPTGSSVTYSRVLRLEFPGFPTQAGASKTYDGSSAAATYTGSLVVNAVSASGVANYDYTVQTGKIIVTTASDGKTAKLRFTLAGLLDAVDGAVMSSETFSAPLLPNSGAITVSNNLAAKPFVLSNPSGYEVAVAIRTDSSSWV